VPTSRKVADYTPLHLRDFTEAAHMSLGVAEVGGQERLDKVPGHGRSDGPAAHANKIHLIILDTLPRREVIVDQPGADAGYFVGTDGSAHAAPADCHATLDLPRGNGSSERDDEVGIVIVRGETMRPEIDNLMTCRTELRKQFLLQTKSAVIRRDSHEHFFLLLRVDCVPTQGCARRPFGVAAPVGRFERPRVGIRYDLRFRHTLSVLWQ
jgi:hypothetical protein